MNLVYMTGNSPICIAKMVLSGLDTGTRVTHVWPLKEYSLNKLYSCLFLWNPLTKIGIANDTKTVLLQRRVQMAPDQQQNCLVAADPAPQEGPATHCSWSSIPFLKSIYKTLHGLNLPFHIRNYSKAPQNLRNSEKLGSSGAMGVLCQSQSCLKVCRIYFVLI